MNKLEIRVNSNKKWKKTVLRKTPENPSYGLGGNIKCSN